MSVFSSQETTNFTYMLKVKWQIKINIQVNYILNFAFLGGGATSLLSSVYPVSVQFPVSLDNFGSQIGH